MRIPLVGGSNQERSLPFNAERTINLRPIFDQTGKENASLLATPGLFLFATCGTGPVRGEFAASNGRCFVVSGATLYEITSAGVATSRGTLTSSSGIVSIEENGLQLMICDGTLGYIFTYATNAFLQITDVDFPSAGTVTFIDGYFVINKNSSGAFYISSLYDGLTWAALDFATAESSPDDLLRVLNAVGQLWLLGSKTTEIYTNTGANNFPFERVSGAKLEVGILAPHTATAVDNSLFWVGRDNKGSGIVYRANGYTPQRISTTPIELLIQAAPTPTTLRADTYQQDGSTIYRITGGGMSTTLNYDIGAQVWFETAYLNTAGVFEAHLGISSMFAFGKTLVGSRVDGSVYEMSPNYNTDNGATIAHVRRFQHLSDESKRTRYSQLEIGFESGVGNQSDPASDPVVSLRLSRDGGRTWSSYYNASIGKVGQYLKRAVWRRLGISTTMTFELRITDAVKVSITGAYLT